MQTMAADTQLGVAVRPLDASEVDLVVDSWQRSYRKAAERIPLVAELAPEAYRRAQRVVSCRLLARSVTLAAVLPSVPDEVLGYVVLERQGGVLVLHWLYVKQAYRRAGVAKALIGAALQVVPSHALLSHSHETEAGRGLALRLRSKFNPLLAR